MSAILVMLSGFSNIIVPSSAILFLLGLALVTASAYMADDTEDEPAENKRKAG